MSKNTRSGSQSRGSTIAHLLHAQPPTLSLVKHVHSSKQANVSHVLKTFLIFVYMYTSNQCVG